MAEGPEYACGSRVDRQNANNTLAIGFLPRNALGAEYARPSDDIPAAGTFLVGNSDGSIRLRDSPADSIMRLRGMHERTQIELSAADRAKLKTIVANRNHPQKHVWRIVLLTPRPATAPPRSCGEPERSRPSSRAGKKGLAPIASLWRDKTRPSRIPPLAPRGCRARGGLNLGETVPKRHPLDGRSHGRSAWDPRQFGTAHLAGGRSAA